MKFLHKAQNLNNPLIGLLLLCCGYPAMAVDMENGMEINEVCAGCHGEFGQGGKKGEYPRLAGMPAAFLAKQLHLFRDRKRPNMAMIEYVDQRQMPDDDINDIAHYLESLTLQRRLPAADENAAGFDAYERLLAARRIMQIPRYPGDTKLGRTIYRKECASCHGKAGWGDPKDAVPQLAGQYISYLWRQVAKYRQGVRIHDEEDPDDELLADFSDEELTNIFAYLSIVDD